MTDHRQVVRLLPPQLPHLVVIVVLDCWEVLPHTTAAVVAVQVSPTTISAVVQEEPATTTTTIARRQAVAPVVVVPVVELVLRITELK